MSATYTKHGLGASGMPWAVMFPGRDNGPNHGVQVHFPSGAVLSLVMGWGSHASPETVEVAVFTGAGGQWLTREIAEAIFGVDIGDDVDGYCDADRVHAYFLAAQHWEATP